MAAENERSLREVSAGLIVPRRARPNGPGGVRLPAYALLPVIGSAATLWSMLNRHLALWSSLLVWMLIGLLGHVLYRRRGGRPAHTPGSGGRGRHRVSSASAGEASEEHSVRSWLAEPATGSGAAAQFAPPPTCTDWRREAEEWRASSWGDSEQANDADREEPKDREDFWASLPRLEAPPSAAAIPSQPRETAERRPHWNAAVEPGETGDNVVDLPILAVFNEALSEARKPDKRPEEAIDDTWRRIRSAPG